MVPDVGLLPGPPPPSSSRLGAPEFPALPTLARLPQRLYAEPAGWVTEVDVVVIGSGIAGLTAALECRDLGKVMFVTKHLVAAGSTNWAQGGIASVQAEGDTVQQHIDDTLVAGAGLCVPDAVRVLVSEGPEEVAKLIARGAEFDRDSAGDLALTREGGHHRSRIAHAGGDATGAEIERALIAAVTADRAIEIVQHALVLDVIPAEVRPGEPAGGAVAHRTDIAAQGIARHAPPTRQQAARSRHQHRVDRVGQKLRIVGRIMEPAALLPTERAADDQVGDLDQVAQLDEVGRNAEMAVIIGHLLPQHVDPALGPLEPLGGPDDSDIIPHQPADLAPNLLDDNFLVALGDPALVPGADRRRLAE